MLPLTVVIADDHAGVRKTLRLLIEAEITLKLVGEAANGLEAIRVVHALHPALLLIDVKMPQMSGLEVLQYLRNEKNPLVIIIFSDHAEAPYLEAANRLGADAFVAKASGFEVLMDTIRSVQREHSLWVA